MIAVVVSSKLATLTELGTSLGTEDLHDLLEVAAVDSHNRRVMSEPD